MTGTAGEIRIGPPEILLRISRGMTEVRAELTPIGDPHTVLDALPGGAPPAMAEVAALLADLSRANEKAVVRLAAYASGADRSINLTAYALAYVATRFPETDAANSSRLLGVVVDAKTAAPPAPDPAGTDPAFVSPGTR